MARKVLARQLELDKVVLDGGEGGGSHPRGVATSRKVDVLTVHLLVNGEAFSTYSLSLERVSFELIDDTICEVLFEAHRHYYPDEEVPPWL